MLKLSNLESIGKPVYKFQNNHSVDFDGVDDFIQLGEPISYTQHTISTWVKISDTGVSKTIIDARDAADDGIRIRTDANEQIIYEVGTSDISTSDSFVDVWTHIVATYDGTTQKLYINGSLVSSATTEQEISTTTNAKIGARNFNNSANIFAGKIDELAIYDRALEEEEVTKIYRIKYGANLVQNGNFDELGSELVTDGGFTDASNWNLTIGTPTVSGGTGNFPDETNSFIIQSSVVDTTVKTYKLQYEVVESNAGNLRLAGGNSAFGTISLTNTVGVHTKYITSNGSKTALQFNNGSSFIGKIDNVSVKQVDPNDRFTLGTGVEYGNGFVKMNNSEALQGAEQLNVITSGVKCKVTFTVQNYVSGTVNLRHPLSQEVTANGTYVFIGEANSTKLLIRGNALTNNFEVTNLMVEQQKYVATNLKLNSTPYSSSNLRNYYRMGDGILDKFPFINDMIAPSLANISTTNLVTHSEDLSQWGKSNVTRTSGFTAPDGTKTAYKLITTSDNENAGVHINVTTESGTTYVMSGFFKNQNVTGKTSFMARVSGGTLFRRSISFNGAIATTSTYASTGTVDGIQLFDKGNGWYRFSFYFVADGTTTQVEVDVDRENEAVGNAIYFWGAMLEEGFQASEYIKTEGSTVSRTATVENVYGTMTNMTEEDITNDVPS
tara:strand:+ start:289 stop:2289 length:2001 start_codon:yes stop_codon:yes gene_type:complete